MYLGTVVVSLFSSVVPSLKSSNSMQSTVHGLEMDVRWPAERSCVVLCLPTQHRSCAPPPSMLTWPGSQAMWKNQERRQTKRRYQVSSIGTLHQSTTTLSPLEYIQCMHACKRSGRRPTDRPVDVTTFKQGCSRRQPASTETAAARVADAAHKVLHRTRYYCRSRPAADEAPPARPPR